MKKLFSFLLVLFLCICGFGQGYINMDFINPKTGAKSGKTINIDVNSGQSQKIVLKLSARTETSQSVYNFSKLNSNNAKVTLPTFNTIGGLLTSDKEKEIVFEVMESVSNETKIQYAFRLDENVISPQISNPFIKHDLYINVTYKTSGGTGGGSNSGNSLTNGTGTCSGAPTGLRETSVGNNHTFVWNSVDGTMPYTLAFLPSGSQTWLFHTSNTNTFNIPLTPNHSYSVTVRANCKLWSEKIQVRTYNKCNENVTIDKSNNNYTNFQANNVLTITNSTLKNSNSRGSKVIVKNSKILPTTKIYVQGCYGGKNENSIDDVIYSNIQSEISDSTTVVNSIIPNTTFKTTIQNYFTISPNPTSNFVQVNSTIGINEWFVYDINAKTVLSGNNKNGNNLKINLQQLNVGLYYFKFSDSSGTIHEKTIIKK